MTVGSAPGGRMRRRSLLAGGAALASLAVLPWARAQYVWQPGGTLSYRVSADGQDVGSLAYTFERTGGELHVHTAVAITVDIAFVTVWRYAHQAMETWRDGRLVAFVSDTDDDGKPHHVDGTATADGFRIVGPEGTYMAPADVMAASYWNREILTRTMLFDPQDGELTPQTIHGSARETIRAGGRPIQAMRYDLTAKETGSVWYEDSGRWIASAFERRGTLVEQRLAG